MFYYSSTPTNTVHDGSDRQTTMANRSTHAMDDDNDLSYARFGQSLYTSTTTQQNYDTMDDSHFLSYTSDVPSHTLDSSFFNDMLFSPAGFGQDMFLGKDLDDLVNDASNQQNNNNSNNGANNAAFGKHYLPLASHHDESTNPSDARQTTASLALEAHLSLEEQDQQAILLSDPNFLRQQQLLQEQQRAMEIRLEEQHDPAIDVKQEGIDSLEIMTLESGQPNLSSAYDDHDPSSMLQHFLPFDEPFQLSHPPTQPFPEIQPQQSGVAKASKPLTKKDNKRSGYRTTSPIPISTNNVSAGQSSSVPSEIDHHRRFTELQARFRINYVKKSGQSAKPRAASSYSGPGIQKQASSPGRPMGSLHNDRQSTAASVSEMDSQNQKRSPRQEPVSPRLRIREAGPMTNNNGVGKPAPRKMAPNNPPLSFPSRTMPIQIQRVHRPNHPAPIDAEQYQKKLDEQLEKVDFTDITVSELKEMLRQRGKLATGKKAVLMQRLLEERDSAKNARSGRMHRYSQPIPSSSGHRATESIRPRSYQGTSPLLPHTNPSSVPQSPLLVGSPSSVPGSSTVLPGSPNSATLSLNRSIANMHIGSPPLTSQHPRRYSPYAGSSSPRLSSSSPKFQSPKQPYSSSMPTDGLSLSPGSPGFVQEFSSSFTSRARLPYYHNYGNARTKTYAPFTSSALATPDRDDDQDPFDDLDTQDNTMKYEYEQQQSSSNVKSDTADWVSTMETILRPDGNPTGFGIPENLTQDELLALLPTSVFDQGEMMFDTSFDHSTMNQNFQ